MSNSKRVRCYSCGKRQHAGRPSCARCGAEFGSLCSCGARLSIYTPVCPECGVRRRIVESGLPQVPWKPALLVVAVLMTLIQQCPWGTDTLLAIKRVIIVAFPASMSAVATDALK